MGKKNGEPIRTRVVWGVETINMHFQIPIDVRKRLEDLAKERRVFFGKIINEALVEYLERNRKDAIDESAIT